MSPTSLRPSAPPPLWGSVKKLIAQYLYWFPLLRLLMFRSQVRGLFWAMLGRRPRGRMK